MDEVVIPVDYEIKYSEDDDESYSYGITGTEKDEKDNSDSYSITEQYDRYVPDKINESEQDDKPHNDKPITNIEISPNGKYLVTYSKKDCSIIGWDISGTVEGRLKPDSIVETGSKRVNQICISDDKKLAYIYNDDSNDNDDNRDDDGDNRDDNGDSNLIVCDNRDDDGDNRDDNDDSKFIVGDNRDENDDSKFIVGKQ
jgi:hypothetical protein